MIHSLATDASKPNRNAAPKKMVQPDPPNHQLSAHGHSAALTDEPDFPQSHIYAEQKQQAHTATEYGRGVWIRESE